MMYLKTPLIQSIPLTSLASKNNGGLGNELTNVYLKLENVQPSGSFKLRGISNIILKKKEQGFTQFISSSGGNAGLAAAYACMKLKVPLTVYVPETTSDNVISNLRLMGADVIRHGRVWDETDTEARRVCSQTPNASYVHPFDDPLIWEGHATIIDEIKEQLNGEQPDCIIASIGGGGLMCGLIEGLIRNDWLNDSIDVFAVETVGADCFNKSVQNSEIITLDGITSIAKSLGAKTCSKQLFDYYNKYSQIIKSIVVSDKQAVDACLKFLDDHKFLVEVACGTSLAVTYNPTELLDKKKYKNIVVIVCGGSSNYLNELLLYKNKFNL